VNDVARFIEVNKQLFALSGEKAAEAHIASLTHPDARGLAESLWLIEKVTRKMATPTAAVADPRSP